MFGLRNGGAGDPRSPCREGVLGTKPGSAYAQILPPAPLVAFMKKRLSFLMGPPNWRRLMPGAKRYRRPRRRAGIQRVSAASKSSARETDCYRFWDTTWTCAPPSRRSPPCRRGADADSANRIEPILSPAFGFSGSCSSRRFIDTVEGMLASSMDDPLKRMARCEPVAIVPTAPALASSGWPNSPAG